MFLSYWQRADQALTAKIHKIERERSQRQLGLERFFRVFLFIGIIAQSIIFGFIVYFQTLESTWYLLFFAVAGNVISFILTVTLFPTYRRRRYEKFVSKTPYTCEAMCIKKTWIPGRGGPYYYLSFMTRDGRQYNGHYVQASLYKKVQIRDILILVSLDNRGSIDSIYPYYEIFDPIGGASLQYENVKPIPIRTML